LNRPLLVIVALSALLFVIAVISLAIGAVSIPLSSMVGMLFGVSSAAFTETEAAIVSQLRLPRILTACLVGSSLGAAGVGFQCLFRNPLADPYVIGASSGAGLGVTLAVIIGFHVNFLGFSGISLAALIGSVLAVIVVYGIGSIGGQNSPLSLLLAGVALSSMINAVVSLLMFMNDEKIVVIFGWLMGSLAGNDWHVVRATTASSLVGCGLLWSMSRPLDANLLGEAAAQSLGLHTVKFRLLIVTAAGITTAAAVSAAGIIGFVGLIAPHIARAFVGPRHAWLTPTSAIVGAIILLVSDGIARTVVAPAELPVGIVTALLGCPFFLFLLKSRHGLASLRT